MGYKPISVTELSNRIKICLEGNMDLLDICVQGEISNYKVNSSGYVYFSLKDDTNVVKCIIFPWDFKKYNLDALNLKDGDKIFTLSDTTVYPAGGYYQLRVRNVKKAGIGALYEEFEKLKAKLLAEGLFDPAHKQKLPLLPSKIGVITSRTGAVIHDIENVARRRHPNIDIYIYAVSVQGKGSAEQIVEGIRYMNENTDVDVLIVGRGGGSMEDLWSFNDERVVRAIYDSKIPVIAAVGHDTDITLTNYVSDVVAPTPSAAAELAVPSIVDLKKKIQFYKESVNKSMESRISTYNLLLKNKTNILKQNNPINTLNNKKIQIDKLKSSLDYTMQSILTDKKHRIQNIISKLETLNPLDILKRGYSVVKKEGKSVTDANQLEKGDVILIKLNKGEKQAQVL